jgi:MFS superfamily sulfate permease-like transporter
MVAQLVKWNVKFTADQKKTNYFRVWNLIATLLPLCAIIIAGRVAYDIQNGPSGDTFFAKKLSLVGQIPPGLNILRIPKFRHAWGPFFGNIIPLTLISFMESYSIARNAAAANNQLNMLSASQEMVANGFSNLLACVSSAYPATGSFSRSALVYHLTIYSMHMQYTCIFYICLHDFSYVMLRV